jgi:hypothetical protein
MTMLSVAGRCHLRALNAVEALRADPADLCRLSQRAQDLEAYSPSPCGSIGARIRGNHAAMSCVGRGWNGVFDACSRRVTSRGSR